MSKTKGKNDGQNKPVVNNINNLNIEIDYDKLADAIVRAEVKAKAPQYIQDNKRGFWSAVWCILKGEKSDDGRYLSAPFAFITSFFFRSIAIFGTLFIIVIIVATSYILFSTSWEGTVALYKASLVVFSIGILFIWSLIFLILWGAANDVEHEKDKNYIIAIFSGLVSFVALIVAFVALYKQIKG